MIINIKNQLAVRDPLLLNFYFMVAVITGNFRNFFRPIANKELFSLEIISSHKNKTFSHLQSYDHREILISKNISKEASEGTIKEYSFQHIKELLAERGVDLSKFPADHFDVNSYDINHETLLHHAIRLSDPSLINLLISCGADVNMQDSNGNTPLNVAVFNNNPECIQELIKHHANTNIKNKLGYDALARAIINNYLFAIDILYQGGADMNNKLAHGETALHLVVSENNIAAIEKLIACGANVNSKNDSGKTPLHRAVDNNNIAAIEKLIACGANVNAKNDRGETPLHTAAANNNIEIIKKLYELGADLKIGDNRKRTPLMIAGLRGQNEATAWLSSKQPESDIQGFLNRYDLFSIFGGEKISPILEAINNEETHSGGNPARSFSRLASELEAFSEYVPVEMQEQYKHVINDFKNFQDSRDYSPEKLLETIKSEKEVLLNTGCVGHHISALFELNEKGQIQLLLFDRGETAGDSLHNSDKHSSVRRIVIPEDKLATTLVLLQKAENLENEAACRVLFEELPKEVSNDFISEMAHSLYKEGICFFANPKTIINYLFIKKFGQSLGSSLYKNFTLNMRQKQLNSYLKYANANRQLLDPKAHVSLGKKGNDILKKKISKLHEAALKALKNNDIGPLSLLLKRKDFNFSNETLFQLLYHCARLNSDKEFAFICQGVPGFKKRLTAEQIHQILEVAKSPITDVLQKNGISIQIEKYEDLVSCLTKYRNAIDINSFESILTKAIQEGFDINYYDENVEPKMPLLHLACMKGDLEVVEVLCKLGANINKKTEVGTALHNATADAAAILCAKGCNLTAQASKPPYETAMDCAIMEGDTDKVRVLLAYRSPFEHYWLDDNIGEDIKKMLEQAEAANSGPSAKCG
jgi:ankyrin repeat protein